MMIQAEPTTQTSSAKNCYRCGVQFPTEGSERVCEGCRKPRLLKPKSINGELSFRERQVVSLVRLGKLNKQIAYELCLSEGTIKEYLNRIFRKIGTSNRTELAVWAMTNMERCG